jgi:hypothetical protein
MNINVGIHYLGAWLGGNGCVPIHNLMEDAATAEIARAQVWQWIRSPGRADGPKGHGRNGAASYPRNWPRSARPGKTASSSARPRSSCR